MKNEFKAPIEDEPTIPDFLAHLTSESPFDWACPQCGQENMVNFSVFFSNAGFHS